MSNKTEILTNYQNILKTVNDNISKSIESNNTNEIQKYRNNAIELLCKFVECLEITDYLLIDSKPKISEQILIVILH
jgi:anionic cell wall polymer biosynthesis LytR-Cps2A-Psr (LCP) family protein